MDDFIGEEPDCGIARKKRMLYELYSRFEEDAFPFKKNAVCRKGCSFCCTFMGDIDITTLEGMAIRERLSLIPPDERSRLYSMIEGNRMARERGKAAPCPFINEQGACSIYEVRPFTCRQLYSLKKCNGRGATIHRQVYQLSREVITRIQRLDDAGYSGHISFILHLLDDAEFTDVYLSGKFDPERIRDFGRSHKIVINRTPRSGS